MHLYMIVYDIPEAKEVHLAQALRAAKGWWHHLGSCWIVATEHGADIWRQSIMKAIGESGKFVIFDITNVPVDGWMPKSAWDWINNHQSQCQQAKQK